MWWSWDRSPLMIYAAAVQRVSRHCAAQRLADGPAVLECLHAKTVPIFARQSLLSERRGHASNANTAKGSRWNRVLRGSNIRNGKVQRQRKVACRSVANRERSQVPAPLDHLQHRGMVVDASGNKTAPRPGGNDQARNTEAAEAVLVTRCAIGGRDRGSGWRHVLEKPAPFVKVDDEHGIAP